MVLYPEYAEMMHEVKNVDVDASIVLPNSNKRIWWTCPKNSNHAFESTVSYMVGKKQSCPFCSGQIVTIDTCLLTKNPELCKEWNYQKNVLLDPKLLMCNSHKIVWWKCKNGHEWEASVAHRHGGENCPYCSNRKINDKNCLLAINPVLAKEWHPFKNILAPSQIPPNYRKKVWWKCKKGHEWESAVYSRNSGRGCPYCKSFTLKDGTRCDSLTEAFFYLTFKYLNIDFLFNNRYPNFGNHRYDFYFPLTKCYLEVTAFSKKYKNYDSYIKNINNKRKFVKEILHEDFEFLTYKMNRKDRLYVDSNLM
jgi:hypothetical protein